MLIESTPIEPSFSTDLDINKIVEGHRHVSKLIEQRNQWVMSNFIRHICYEAAVKWVRMNKRTSAMYMKAKPL